MRHETRDNGRGSGKPFAQLQPQLSSYDCALIADLGLSGMPLVQVRQQQQWHYLLRIDKAHTCRRWLHGRWMDWGEDAERATLPLYHD